MHRKQEIKALLCNNNNNLSSISLSSDQLKALNGMVKFRQSAKFVPYMQLIAGAEVAAQRLEEGSADAASASEYKPALEIIGRRCNTPTLRIFGSP